MSGTHTRRERTHRRRLAQVAVLATALVLPMLATAPPAAAADRPAVQPLPAHLETIRATEATALYGAPGIRPIEQRRTALITMGDSQISGEGVGNYVPGTHQPGNWCDRSYDQAVFRTGIAADERYNIACSGATPWNLIAGGPTQHNELNQGDHLAIKARNTHIKLIWVVAGANGDGTIQFGPVATDCALRRVLFQGPCWPTYTDQWTVRTDGSRRAVEEALTDIRLTMTNAGYLNSDYELVFMSYASPGSPDVEDNPNFPGWYAGGCLLYLADAAFARNKAVPLFESALRAAAANTGTRYLDASRLFHGHEVCTDNTSVRGLYIELGIWDENAARQSFHPNYRGHGMFAQCITQFYASSQQRATCVDPASTGNGVLYNGLMEFKQLRNAATGTCVDGKGYDSRNGTVQQSYRCHGGRNQGFWYDPTRQSLHSELSHDRCLDVSGGSLTSGTAVNIHDCHGGTNQKFTLSGNQLRAAGNTNLCLAFDNPLLGTPRLRLATCSSNSRQQWSFESRSFAQPVGYGRDDFIGSRVY
ncbi:ricin-type beta-trefoil lectin domain protein [Micromonospora sp. WMMD1082]|uniref:ricin-type beta-trefoil lectin domain protein n=1 Tax=Micromonospora sp. WMMD1082 TaxID=3016104 RepID=UPI002417466A|nr:ricin-type beta-trefoil lectin domain protein [Micromonospora sp. WMMD1082]MDG4794610.1 ricin-type beta-trefoil lectin domain protein [Micromonospora sp. WMMD1082]